MISGNNVIDATCKQRYLEAMSMMQHVNKDIWKQCQWCYM